MVAAAREKVFDFICRFFDDNGRAPTVYEIGEAFSISHVAAWKHVRLLVEAGRLIRGRDKRLLVPGRVDLRPVPTQALVDELARRRAVKHAVLS